MNIMGVVFEKKKKIKVGLTNRLGQEFLDKPLREYK
jgi:hypothetical protein